jgi:pyruvate dehydrogenase E2 component (dihydrolipoamide acetyltransferase)
MSIEIRMPELAPDIDEADVIAWLVEPGAEVERGEPILEIETDKSTVEVESPATGILSEIRVPAGSTDVAVGALLGLIAPSAAPDPPENRPQNNPEDPQEATGPASSPAPSTTSTPSTPSAPPANVIDSDPAGDRSDPAPERPAAPAEASKEPSPQSTALARRLAEQAGVEIGRVHGSGPRGRITRADIERESRAPGVGAGPEAAVLRMEADCDATALVQTLAELAADPLAGEIPATALVLRAAALGLRDTAEVDPADAEPGSARVSIAFSIAGSPAPARRVDDADRKGLASLAAELLAPGEESALGEAQPPGPDLALAYLDVEGVDRHWPAHPAGARISLGIAPPRPSPTVRGESPVAGYALGLTLSAAEGESATAARLLARIRRLIEHPLEMTL